MVRDLTRSALAILALTVLCGLAYPLAVWGVAQVAFNDSANGSLVERDGRVVGSSRLGQAFTGAQWFQPRPSAVAYSSYATGDEPTPAASAGTNLGPNAQALADQVGEALTAVAERDGVAAADVPSDLVTSSGSGLDPDISLAGALQQVPRVAGERDLDEAQVEQLVRDTARSPFLGLLGTDRVNVLSLNLALEDVAPSR